MAGTGAHVVVGANGHGATWCRRREREAHDVVGPLARGG